AREAPAPAGRSSRQPPAQARTAARDDLGPARWPASTPAVALASGLGRGPPAVGDLPGPHRRSQRPSGNPPRATERRRLLDLGQGRDRLAPRLEGSGTWPGGRAGTDIPVRGGN